MTIKFPLDWQALRFPHKRAELMSYLAEISSTAPGSDPGYEDFDIDEIVHFFFDDTGLGDPQESAVGDILFNDREETFVREVTTAVNEVLRELGDVKSRAFLAHPSWPLIRLRAQRALEVLGERGSPRIEP